MEPDHVARPGPRHEIGRPLRQVAVEAAKVGLFDWDLVTGELSWDARLRELFGYDEHTFGGTIEAFNDRVHPDDLPRVARAIEVAVETCADYEAEYRVLLPDGTLRWLGASGRVLTDLNHRPVRLIGAAYDISPHREGDARVVQVLEVMPAAFLSLDRDWRLSYVNAEGEKLLGRPREELVGGDIWELFPAAVGSDFDTNSHRALREQEPVTFEAYYPHPLDRWYEVRAWPSSDGLSVYFQDVTARRAAQRTADRAVRRATLIAEVNAQLGSTLDAEAGVASLARLMIPELADWCLVTLAESDPVQGDWRRGLRDLAWAHARPGDEPLVAGYAASRLEALTDASPLAVALREGRPVLLDAAAGKEFLASLAPGPAREFMRRLAPESAAVVPLVGPSGTVGLITLYNGAGRPPLGKEELAVVLDMAARAGLALDNARLYAGQRRLAEELQRSMLTDPPELDHLEVVVRYEAATETAQVGGDWYDAFRQRSGDTVIVIGDVVGHDTAAAAAMGQLRGLLRGIAGRAAEGPAEILHEVDDVMDLLRIDTTATAVVGRLERSPEQRSAGRADLRWSNAGHPPPAVIDEHGTVRLLADEQPELLLGIHHLVGRARTESVVTLDPGATVLLYTDGLVERRDQPIDEGLVRLRQALAGLAHLPLPELCDRLLERLLPPRPEDDVALVAVRLGPAPVRAG